MGQLNNQTGGQLNPAWVCCLMGYPAWWLDKDSPSDKQHHQPPLSFDEVSRMVAAQQWPAGRGEPQHDWEPPRTVRDMKGRAAMIKMLGNAVVPQWAVLGLAAIAALERRRAV